MACDFSPNLHTYTLDSTIASSSHLAIFQTRQGRAGQGRAGQSMRKIATATLTPNNPIIYSPLHPPSLPLAVRNPYLNAWSIITTSSPSSGGGDGSSRGGTLNNQPSRFWTNEALGWEGIVVVDGVAYEYLGSANGDLPSDAQYTPAEPLGASYDSQTSNFTFRAGPVVVVASFFSPVTPADVCRSAIPLSYLTTSVWAVDGQPHHIQFYSDIASNWLGVGSAAEISCALKKNSLALTDNSTAGVNSTSTSSSSSSSSEDDIFTWQFSRRNAYVFGEDREFPQWGNFTFTTSPSTNNNNNTSKFSFECGEATAVRTSFFRARALSNDVSAFRAESGDHTPVFAFSHDFGAGNNDNVSVRYTLGSAQDPIVQYITDAGLTRLAPWWRTCYGDLDAMVRFHWDDFEEVGRIGYGFEKQLRADVETFYGNHSSGNARSSNSGENGTDQYGERFTFDSSSAYGFLDPGNWTGVAVPYVSEARSYYGIVALSARQVMGAYVFAQDPKNSSEPLIYQKEISSNGNVNTVDVLYPASPFFLYANPDLLRYALQPLYDYQEARFYPNGYCAHDLGARFPNATGHVEGTDEYMPVEESADLILMSYAYYKFAAGDDAAAWLTSHYALLRQFAQYLVQFALVPEAQLSTDDFAGALPNQTNLAIKGIVGLRVMSHIAALASQPGDAAHFADLATSYYEAWESYAVDPSGKHTVLAYQWRSSWGLLYNIYFDKLLNLGLVSEEVYAMQSAWYPTVSQAYGVPLDNRHHYTKSDWQVWTAATCHAATRRLFVDAIAYWLNKTATDGAFGDLYECVGRGSYPPGTAFRARPVVGGHFALLALARTGQHASAEGRDTSGSLFPRDSTKPLPVPGTPIPPPDAGILDEEQRRRVQGVVTTVLSSDGASLMNGGRLMI
ncbi:DUF1793-domain-containing protein [Xylariaceae sp. FL0594]|nr:DUF1793-domain-containing protein [Xylariaceae sp. FL0594]